MAPKQSDRMPDDEWDSGTANGGFVTEWARPEEPGDIKYPKPDLTQITWLENHDPIVSGLNDDDPGSAVPGGDADRR